MTTLLEEKHNPLFNRKEIVLEIQNETTPSHLEVQKILSEKFKADESALKIKKIEGRFGSKIFKIFANVYPSKEDKEEIELKTKKEKEAESKALEESRKAVAEAKKKAEEEKKKAGEEAKKEAEKSREESKTETKEEKKEEKAE